jgi:uncharacterized membrane protein
MFIRRLDMKTHRFAIAIALLALAACATPEPPASTDAPMAKRAPGDSAPPMQIFRAFGTEPFWNVNVQGNTLTYTTPEDQAGIELHGMRRAIDGGVEIDGSDDGISFALAVRAGECSDGMSDNRYELVSTFRYGDVDLKGCAEVAK